MSTIRIDKCCRSEIEVIILLPIPICRLCIMELTSVAIVSLEAILLLKYCSASKTEFIQSIASCLMLGANILSALIASITSQY